MVLRAGRADDVVALACQHGARVHGFTPVWYTPHRLGLITAAVKRSGAGEQTLADAGKGRAVLGLRRR